MKCLLKAAMEWGLVIIAFALVLAALYEKGVFH